MFDYRIYIEFKTVGMASVGDYQLDSVKQHPSYRLRSKRIIDIAFGLAVLQKNLFREIYLGTSFQNSHTRTLTHLLTHAVTSINNYLHNL